MATNGSRFLDDDDSLAALVGQLTPTERSEYESLRALSLESGFPNRRMVIYTLAEGRPVNLSMLVLGDMEMTRIGGPTIDVRDEHGSVFVGVSPIKWRDRNLYIHVPQNFIFKWKGKDTARGVQFVPHYAMLIKTRSKEHHQIDGDTYCTTLNRFKERFPEVQFAY
jgi:hypothetical protein